MDTHDCEVQHTIRHITRSGGLLCVQSMQPAPAEIILRREAEARKAHWVQMSFPDALTLMTPAQITTATLNITQTAWGADWFARQLAVADHITRQSASYTAAMIPVLTATSWYTFNCPACVGIHSIEGAGTGVPFHWDYRDPDVIRCRACGHVFPDSAYPETGILDCPRREQRFTYYQTDAERQHPDDYTGTYAWHWVGSPVHASFAGIIRLQQIRFMFSALECLATAYLFTSDDRYAHAGKRILLRVAACYPHWLYFDYFSTVADCDPLYAAYHHAALPLLWKRNPAERMYAASSYYGHQDTPDCAVMSDQFGAGRLFPGIDGAVDYLRQFYYGFDVFAHAVVDGCPLLSVAERETIIRDFLLEDACMTEAFLGGPGHADSMNNKAPSAYYMLALAGRVLNIPEFIDVAYQGVTRITDACFFTDGFSAEAPLYTHKYVSGLAPIFALIDGYHREGGCIDLFRQHPKMQMMLHTLAGSLCAHRLPPIGDTPPFVLSPSDIAHVVRMVGIDALPDSPAAMVDSADRCVPILGSPGLSREFVCTVSADDFHTARPAPGDVFYPDYHLPLLRHGAGAEQSALALTPFTREPHQHHDCLGIWWMDRGRSILGELGYVCDSPIMAWAHDAQAHNLVRVDGQAPCGEDTRWAPCPALLLSTPHVSAFAGEAPAFGACHGMRRLALLVRGPEGRTFVVDITHVRGGCEHRWRVFSEIGANNAPEHDFALTGVQMPSIPPHPDFGGSTAPEHITALHATVRGMPTSDAWQALWSESGYQSRLTMLTAVDAVEVHSAPGQETFTDDIGRRVRMLDAVRVGAELASTFVAIHEAVRDGEELPVTTARVLPLPVTAGDDALALEIQTPWHGRMLVFCDITGTIDVDGVCFRGELGVWNVGAGDSGWYAATAASTCTNGVHGFTDDAAAWVGDITRLCATDFTPGTSPPAHWITGDAGAADYVFVTDGAATRAYRVELSHDRRIVSKNFPLTTGQTFRFPATRYRAW